MIALIRLSAVFPSVGVKTSSEKALKILGADPARYLGMAVALSLIAALLTLVAALVAKATLFIAPAAFALVFAFLIYLPKMEVKKRTAEIESSMPFFLRSVGMLLEMGLPFRKALEAAAQGEGALQEEIWLALKKADDGLPLQRAISALANDFGSLPVKRAVSQMISAYETGASGAEMRRIGDDLLSHERHRMREYAAKSSLFGLMFVISSAIMPTFFMVYAIAGSKSLGRPELTLMMLVVFPSVGALLLMLSKSMMPRSALHRGSMDLRMLAAPALFICGFVLLPGLQMILMVSGAAVGLFLAFDTFKAERRLEEIESRLPDALFCVGGMPKSARPERIFSLLEEGGFGALSQEAAKSRRQMELNVPAGAALEDMASRNRSPLLERACRMLSRMIETSSLDKMGSLAEDMINVFQAGRERAQSLAMQKYTLILGAVLMPLIMKMVLGLLGQMGSLLGEGSVETVAFCATLVPPYIVIYSASSAIAISDAEGKGSALAIYSVGLTAVGLAAFHFIKF